MLPPFELLAVSWPQPARVHDSRWTSEPAWDAPRMPQLPRWSMRLIDEAPCWTLDWRDFFRTGVLTWDPYSGGEMRGFYVVFRVRMLQSGALMFWDDDGSIVRYGNEVIHEDRGAHPLAFHELNVAAGDVLEIAQWQLGWDWLWCARIHTPGTAHPRAVDAYLDRLPLVEQLLHAPTGPALKIYTNGHAPFRALTSIYSMILNGYSPDGVWLFGEEQWPERARTLFRELLPFARVVVRADAEQAIRVFGGPQLVELSRRHWFVMKTFVALAMAPAESCVMDDDVFILDSVSDALEEFERCDLVFSPDQDWSDGYIRTWRGLLGRGGPIATGRLNAGLYWIRNSIPMRHIALAAMRTRAEGLNPVLWEQGLIAISYADRKVCQLPHQRYLFPAIDGLPGGVGGYDYAGNPCSLASIHFAGLPVKPSEALAVQVFPGIADRARNVSAPRAEAVA